MFRALSVLLLVVEVGALLLRQPFARKYAYGLEAVRPLHTYELPCWQKVLAGVFVYGTVLAAFLPTLTVIVSSFLESQGPILLPAFSLEGYRGATRLTLAPKNPAILVTAATVLCVVVGSLGNVGAASVVGTVLIALTIIPSILLFKVFGQDEDFLV